MRRLIIYVFAFLMIGGLSTTASAQTLEVTPAALNASLIKKGLESEIVPTTYGGYILYSYTDGPDYHLLFDDCDTSGRCKRILFYCEDDNNSDDTIESIKDDTTKWPKSAFVTDNLKKWPNHNLTVLARLTEDNMLGISMLLPTPNGTLSQADFWGIVDMWMKLDDDFFMGY
ncbi:MAG: hypothetical protein QM645_00230 [Asticcacaulis sp.]